MACKRLTFEEREKIEKLLKEGLSCSHISRIIGRGKNVVVAEVRRAGGRETYTAKKGQERANESKRRQVSAVTNRANDKFSANHNIVRKLYEKGKNFYEIHEITGINYIHLSHIYKNLNLKKPITYDGIHELHKKIYALEEQIKVIFEFLEERK